MKKILLIAIALSLVSASVILLVQALTSYSVDPGQTVTISEHGVTKTITNNNAKKMFIPTKTAAEWQSFVDHAQNVTVADPTVYVDDVFSAYLYTGTGNASNLMARNGINLIDGGMVWIKSRSGATDNKIFDTIRGPHKALVSNSTSGSEILSSSLSSFYTDYTPGTTGFMLNENTSVNNLNSTYASWTFRKASKFFDVVTYTGDGTSNRQIAHSLGIEPGMIVVKGVTTTGNWVVYHRSKGVSWQAFLNTTDPFTGYPGYWGAPTDTVFTVNTDAWLNQSGQTYVAYLFAHDPAPDGKIQCGSYVGNGSSSGQTVILGWEPQWILKKRSDTSDSGMGNWMISDNMREIATPGNDRGLYANLTNSENGSDNTDLSPNGFIAKDTGVGGYNRSGATYIYCAIRRPNKPPVSSASVYNAIARTGTGAAATVTGVGFAPDLALFNTRNTASHNKGWFDRLRGVNTFIRPHSTGAEVNDNTTVTSFGIDGVGLGVDTSGYTVTNVSPNTYINHFFRRAPGFFDIVAYTGTGVARTVPHNLGVVPEMMIVKTRNSSDNDWAVYVAPLGVTKHLRLNGVLAEQTGSNRWGGTAPTAYVFTVGNENETNWNTYNFISYLFATLPGISKVGSYTGTGAQLDIDAGFATGPAFLLIKRTDSTGDWYLWDSTRGIVSAGNDPYLLLNSTAAEVTNTNYIDPINTGFRLTSTAPAVLNASGGNYIYYSVAKP